MIMKNRIRSSNSLLMTIRFTNSLKGLSNPKSISDRLSSINSCSSSKLSLILLSLFILFSCFIDFSLTDWLCFFLRAVSETVSVLDLTYFFGNILWLELFRSLLRLCSEESSHIKCSILFWRVKKLKMYVFSLERNSD